MPPARAPLPERAPPLPPLPPARLAPAGSRAATPVTGPSRRAAGRRAAPLLLRQAERRARRHVHRRARLAGGQARGGRVAARRQEGQRQRVLPEGDGRVAARVPLGRGARQPDAQPQAARRRGRGQRRARRGLPRGERRSVSFSFRLKEWHLV
ncbi:hypothetical protein EMIHUDRAFT_435639, partial [Emiliania huxleyi CCMP1516]|uniref:Uncharacterized protein n=2 Tax=Emiliania huxleyi TaxID=2903 RepID=A0A0D3JFN6_EMIH1